ncbi:MAG: L,D-transpeptidase family protein [Desulfotomaculaceae bacterium]
MTSKNYGVTGRRLEINTVSRKLHHYEGERLIKEYPVAVGKPSTPTPPGKFKVINKILHPGGILGTRWMGLSIPGGNYGIHGTSNPASIGTAASLGCIRMFNQNVEELFGQVSVGTPVHIYNRAVQNANPGSTSTSPGPPLNGGKTYIVKPGDNLWNISRKFNVSLDALIAANNLADPNRLNPGQKLVIP